MDFRRFLSVLLVAASVAATEARPDEPVTPEEFADYALGWTLHFERDGEPWGTESFGDDGSVRWRYPGGECMDGVWRAYEGQVCFFYGPGTDVLCWELRRAAPGGNILARLTGTGEHAGMELEITGRDRRPLICTSDGART